MLYNPIRPRNDPFCDEQLDLGLEGLYADAVRICCGFGAIQRRDSGRRHLADKVIIAWNHRSEAQIRLLSQHTSQQSACSSLNPTYSQLDEGDPMSDDELSDIFPTAQS